MKIIRYDSDFRRPDGYPFYIPDPDPIVREKAIEHARSMNRDMASIPMIPVDFAQAIIFFMNGMPWIPDQKPTPEDMGNNYAVIKSFRAARDSKRVELEDQVHVWLLETLRREGIQAFGNTYTEIANRLNDVLNDKEIQ